MMRIMIIYTHRTFEDHGHLLNACNRAPPAAQSAQQNMMRFSTFGYINQWSSGGGGGSK